MSINDFSISFICSVVVYIWLRTDAFYEYFKFTKLKIFKDYGEFKSKTPVPLFFPDFLIVKHPNFLFKLITCPICLSIYFTCALYFSGMKSVNLFASIYLSWLLFFVLEKLNQK